MEKENTYTIKPNTTSVSNWILDNLHLFSELELKILLFINRKTIGWHKETHYCSTSYIAKGIGSRSHGHINEAINSLLAKNIIKRLPAGKSFTYSLNEEFDHSRIENVPNLDNIPKGNDDVPNLGMMTVPQKGNNKINKIYKKTNKRNKYTGWFLEMFNTVTEREFRLLDQKTERQLTQLSQHFSRREIATAVINASLDMRLREELGKDYLTPEYITRLNKFEDYRDQYNPQLPSLLEKYAQFIPEGGESNG